MKTVAIIPLSIFLAVTGVIACSKDQSISSASPDGVDTGSTRRHAVNTSNNRSDTSGSSYQTGNNSGVNQEGKDTVGNANSGNAGGTTTDTHGADTVGTTNVSNTGGSTANHQGADTIGTNNNGSTGGGTIITRPLVDSTASRGSSRSSTSFVFPSNYNAISVNSYNLNDNDALMTIPTVNSFQAHHPRHNLSGRLSSAGAITT